jgi:hypothetical protein
MTATLRKDLGEAGAFLGDKMVGLNGQSLRDVLLEVVNGAGGDLSATQATIAVAALAAKLMKRAGKLTGLRVSVATAGTADSTTVNVRKNGTVVGTLTVAHTEADGIKKSVALSVALAVNDLVSLDVSAAPTGGAGLTCTADIGPDITVES